MNHSIEHPFVNEDDNVWLNETTLPAPALDIEGFYLQDGGEDGLFGYNWTDEETGDYAFRDLDRRYYSYGGKRYSLKEIESLGDCKPESSQAR